MSNIITPRFIAIDSAMLGKIAKDFCSSEEELRTQAKKAVRDLDSNGLVIAICLEHIFELIQHGNLDVVRNRLRFLHALPVLAWVRPFGNSPLPGSHMEIDMREVAAVLDGNSDILTVHRAVKRNFWCFGAGADLISEVDDFWTIIREQQLPQSQRSKIIASILRCDPDGINDCRLRDLKNLGRRSGSEVSAKVAQLARRMADQIVEHGDKTVSDAEKVAQEFYTDRMSVFNEVSNAKGDPFDAIIRFHGFEPSEVDMDMTIAEFGQLAVYQEQLGILSRRLRPTHAITASEVPPEVCPTWTFWQEMRKIQNTAIRVSGSDMVDAELAALSLYADYVHVDKRTEHYVAMLRRDSAVSNFLNHTFKCSDYQRLVPTVTNLDI